MKFPKLRIQTSVRKPARLPDRNTFILKSILIIVLYISTNSELPAQNKISEYKVCFAVGNVHNYRLLILRKYMQNGQSYYIGVNPDNLETCIVPERRISVKAATWNQVLTEYKNSAYIKAIHTAQHQSYPLQDAGIIHGYPKEKGITLTIDLCPSHRPLDRVIFSSLITEFGKIEKPVPLALSITGSFMQSHPQDIDWIKELIHSENISVTWINHTFNHKYNPKIPLSKNFLLEPNTDINYEILQTEIALLEKGLLFSIFFRFPGLVSDTRIVDDVIGYGLIPVGSDAWLAKGQHAAEGSIVLIHGNGNEPIGIKDFIKLLQTEKSAVLKQQWLLYDLRESIDMEFQK